MKNRQESGAVLPIAIAATMVLIMIGFCFFVLSMQMGGSRELLHATDAGSLNVARQSIRKPDISLQQQEEATNFEGLIDRGQISLANYNRVVGQTLLVALNAKAEGTEEARQNAEHLIDLVQGPNGVADRLSDALADTGNMDAHFTEVAYKNSVRMLGLDAMANADSDNDDVAYLEAGTASNVDLDPETIPFNSSLVREALPAGSTVSEKSKKNLNFISGYTPIQIPGFSKVLSGVPVMPGKAPHLVSQKDFLARLNPPKGIPASVPPNSFKSGGVAGKSKGVACSLVGALDTQFTACIPHGYLKIVNGGSASFSGTLGDADQIFAKELMTGIYVGPGSGTNRAFTTDGGLYSQWLNYNRARATGQVPLPPPPPTAGINGDPNSITAEAVRVVWTDYGNNPGTPQAGETARTMLGAFQTAYPHANAGTSYSSNELTAVEHFKALVMQGFGKVTRLHDPTDPAFRQNIPAPTEVTGMKAFNHNGVYASPPGPVAFGRPGSLREFLNQCGANSTLSLVTQRLHQIKPEASESEIESVLDSPAIGMGQTLFIYKNPDSNKLCITASAPKWVKEDVKPDGRKQTLASQPYDLIHSTVNAAGDAGAPVFPFGHSPISEGIDSVEFTPSSGYKNLLGIMSFSNRATGGGEFSDPN